MHKALSWDDARILLAVVRHGTQAAASKALGVDQATVSRRLLRLEDVIGTPLFLRDGARRGADADRLPWVAYDETLADLPEARWLERRQGEPVVARGADVETIFQAVRSGIGRGLLPAFIARRDSGLIAAPAPEPLPSRELWLLVERQVRQIRRVSLTLGWVEAVVRDAF